MKKLLSLLTVSVLIGTSGINLVNTKLFTNNACSFKNSLTIQQNNNQTMTRYDSLNLVDEKNLNNDFSKTINNINNKANSNLNFKNMNYKQSLIKLFNNKKTIINTNNQYENFLKNKSNYKKNKLGISFPMNYNGIYFPWWGFGDYFYLYLSSNVTKKLTNALSSVGSIMAMYTILAKWIEILPELQPIIMFLIMDMVSNWFAWNIPSYNDGNGVCLGITFLPAPIICQVGSQDKYISKINSFEVDYKFLDNDYITTCVDEQGVNILLNYYYNYKPIPTDTTVEKDNETVNNLVNNYLKNLTPIDKTGLGGSITNQDYIDWANTFLNVNSWINWEHLQNFVNKNNDFHSIDIRTQRGNSTWGEQHYSSDYEIWKNS